MPPRSPSPDLQALRDADTALGARIDKEVAARVVGDTSLANRLTAVEDAVKAILATGGGGGGTTPAPNPPPAPPPPDLDPPVQSNHKVGPPTSNSCPLEVTLNEAGTVVAHYGTTTAYGQTKTLTAVGNVHSGTLTGLLANELYHVQFWAVDDEIPPNGPSLSSDRTFTTSQTTPVPSPTRPFAAPTITNQVNVSAGANLQTVVNAAPDGTQFNFPANTLFTMTSAGILLNGRNDLVFELNGSTIKVTSQAGSTATSPFKLDSGNTDIAIRNGTLQGSNPDLGSAIYHAGVESQMGVAAFNVQRLELDNIDIRNVYGDFVYIAGKGTGGSHIPSQDVWVHDSTGDFCGRMGIVPISVTNFIVERCNFDHIGLIAFDVEPNTTDEIVDGLHIRDNTVGQWALSGHQTNWFFACATNVGATFSDKAPLAIRADSNDRITGFNVKDNTTPFDGKGVSGYPTPFYFQHVDSLVVTGNTQPLISGSLVTAGDCPGAVTSPNP